MINRHCRRRASHALCRVSQIESVSATKYTLTHPHIPIAPSPYHPCLCYSIASSALLHLTSYHILHAFHTHTMALSRKRKAEAEESIQSSLKTTKSAASITNPDGEKATPKRRRTASTRSSTPPPPAPGSAVLSSQKRKRTLDPVSEQSDEEAGRKTKIQQGFFRQFAKPKTATTPQSSRFHEPTPVSPSQTPTRNAQQLFDQLNIRATSPTAQRSSKRARALETPPTTPEGDKPQPNAILPTELRDLLSLYSSFLTAISLQSAHTGGSIAAVNLKSLLPLVTANWRKRSVTVNDVRKMLALTEKAGPSFILEDRARAGIFLARAEQQSGETTTNTYIDEAKLNATFETALRTAWTDYSISTPETLLTARAFIRQLPQIDLLQHESTQNASSLLPSRGQQRLADLKASQAASKAEEVASPQAPTTSLSKSTASITNRSTSLLDRILAKQAASANLPTGPTRAELERKSALHRIEDVARVLEMLAGGQPRASFSLSALVQMLQQSLRTPITGEEVDRCLGIMAKEIMPTFVRVVKTGGVSGVVVTRAGKIGFADLKERLAGAGA
jgi:hypothetical protein